MASRIKDRIRDFKKVFKENWKLFKQSKLGTIGLGIIIFFVLMAIFAPIIPYASERDPVMWYAPDKDLIEAKHLWGDISNDYLVNNSAPQIPALNPDNYSIYPIYARPVGFLSNGHNLNDYLETDKIPQEYLEAIYLSTGNVGKGVIDISPVDGSITGLPPLPPGHHSLSQEIPNDFGPVVSSVKVYHPNSYDSPVLQRKGILLITSTTGGITGINAEILNYDSSRAMNDLFPISYNHLWDMRVNGSFSVSAAIYYGTTNNTDDDRILAVTDNGDLYALMPNTGDVVWNTTLNGTGFYTPISLDASNAVVVGTKDGHIYALNASNGDILWNVKYEKEFSRPFIPNIYRTEYNNHTKNNALLYIGTYDGSIYGLRLYDEKNVTGAIAKKAGEIEKSITLYAGSPVSNVYVTPGGETIYAGLSVYASGVPTGLGRIYCINSENIGKEENPIRWEYDNTVGGVAETPVFFRGQEITYFVLDSGNAYAMDNGGNITWKVSVKAGAYIYPPLVANNIPAPRGETAIYKSVILMTKEGDMTALATSGKYLAPLPPGTYLSGNTYLLGTDSMGRDIFSQLIWGSRIALIVGFAASFLSVLIGVLVGVVAGYSGGWIEVVLMRFTDVILVMPFLPLIIVFTALMGPSIWNIILAITLVGWPGTARIIRSQVLSLKERPFIDAARVTGASNTRIMMRHIVPNVMPLAFLYMTFAVTGAILGEASLSFIGLGDPTTMSWGMMLFNISHGSGYTLTAWWWLLPPGIAITLLVLGFFLVGRAFEEIINPRLRRRR